MATLLLGWPQRDGLGGRRRWSDLRRTEASHSVAPQRGSLSFHCERVIRTAAWGFLEDDEPREYRKRRDHQQLVIGDVCDDLRLLRDVERRAWRVGRGHIGT